MTTTERRRQLPARAAAAPVLGASATHIGHMRRVNQDVIVVDPDLGLYANFDAAPLCRRHGTIPRSVGTQLVAHL